VVESDLFAAKRDMLNPDVKRLDEILEGITFNLARSPEQGFPVSPDRRVWFMKTVDWVRDLPQVRIWYRFDDATVELLTIEKVDDLL
jgi:hypothetical protein